MECFTHQKEQRSHLSRVQAYPCRPKSISCRISQNVSLLLVVYNFEHLSIPNMARAQLLRWLRRDAERVPQPPPLKNRLLPQLLLFAQKFIWLLTFSPHLIHPLTERLRSARMEQFQCTVLCAEFLLLWRPELGQNWAHTFALPHYIKLSCVFNIICNK